MDAHLLKYLIDPSLIENPRPRYYEIDLVNYCNLDCHWCIKHRFRPEPKRIMYYDIFLKLWEECRMNDCGIVLSGGEPTLHPDIRAIMHKCDQLLGFGIVSNGTNIDMINYFMDQCDNPNRWIRISINDREIDPEMFNCAKYYPKRIGFSFIWESDEERVKCEWNARILEPYAKFCRVRKSFDYAHPVPDWDGIQCWGRKFSKKIKPDGSEMYCCHAENNNPMRKCPPECRWVKMNAKNVWDLNPFT